MKAKEYVEKYMDRIDVSDKVESATAVIEMYNELVAELMLLSKTRYGCTGNQYDVRDLREIAQKSSAIVTRFNRASKIRLLSDKWFVDTFPGYEEGSRIVNQQEMNRDKIMRWWVAREKN